MATPQGAPRSIYSSAKHRDDSEFTPVDMLPGASIKIMRENPTAAIVRVKAGTVEPVHHHTYACDLLMIKGKKTHWNLSSGDKYELEAGDYVFTSAGDRQRAVYHEDTEFFIKWDGHWDLILDNEKGN